MPRLAGSMSDEHGDLLCTIHEKMREGSSALRKAKHLMPPLPESQKRPPLARKLAGFAVRQYPERQPSETRALAASLDKRGQAEERSPSQRSPLGSEGWRARGRSWGYSGWGRMGRCCDDRAIRPLTLDLPARCRQLLGSRPCTAGHSLGRRMAWRGGGGGQVWKPRPGV